VNEDRWFDHNQNILVQMANTHYGRDLLNIEHNGLPVVYIAKNEVRYLLGMKDGEYECMSDYRVGAKWANVIRSRFSQFRSAAKYFEVSAWEQAGKSMFALDDARVLALTLTAYPDANPETTTMDGFTQRENVSGETWASLRGGAGTTSDDTGSAPGASAYLLAHTNSNTWRKMNRGNAGFDTSTLTASASISAATLSFYGRATTDNFSQSVVVCAATPASNTAIANSDFSNYGTTDFGNARITIASWSTVAYNDFALNASGISGISKTGVSNFGMRLSGDFDNSAPTWASATDANADAYGAEQASTTNDPKLVVTYTIPSAFIPKIIIT
jgi:hypothetical protein